MITKIKGVVTPNSILYRELDKISDKHSGYMFGMETTDDIKAAMIKYGNARVKMSNHMRKLKNKL